MLNAWGNDNGLAETTRAYSRGGEVVARYVVRSTDIKKAADAIAIGQSIGNPNVRLAGETTEMWDAFGCQVREIRPAGHEASLVDIGFPANNLTPSSLTHLLSSVMGGQMDIDIIAECRLVDLELPTGIMGQYSGPRNGIEGIRNYLGAYGRPLVGGIVKPKTGLTPGQLADNCRQMADGGIDFIKEDEILGMIEICPFEQRIEKVMRALEGYKVIFAPALNAPIQQLPDNIAILKSYGCPAFHYNVWGGLDVFKYLADISDGLFAFYQKSGDKVITSGAFSIDFAVWCKLVRLAGADFIHAGMMGGYLDEDKDTMTRRMEALRGDMGGLRSVMPSLSCGATPGMVAYLAKQLGDGIMVSSGGCLHGHPMGTYAGAKAFRDAAEGRESLELATAIGKWGKL